MNLKSAYHHTPIRNEEELTFQAHGKLYQFYKVPFGVTNWVARFQRIMENIVRQHNLCGTYAYVVNINAAGKTQKEHDKNLERSREIAELHKLILSQKKSIISTESIDFLGYTITHGSLRPDVDRPRALKEFPGLHNNSWFIKTLRGQTESPKRISWATQ